MATVIDELSVRIDAELGPLRRALRQANESVSRAASGMREGFSRAEAGVAALTSRLGGLKGAALTAVAVATIGMVNAVGRANAEMQDLELTLQTVFGGMEEGQAAMSFIQTFAQRTPFDIQTLSRAFIQLGGAGIAPTEELLTIFGDAASATTDKVAAFEAMVRIATRAVGGGLGLEELEQLVQQGIPVYQILQDEIGVTRDQISEMGQTAEGASEIMTALNRGLQARFGGGMERAAGNLSVAFSNMGIAANNVLLALGAGVGGVGLNGALTFLADTMSQLMVIITPLANAIGAVLGAALYAVVAPIRLVTESIMFLVRQAVNVLQFAVQYLPDSFESWREAVERLDNSLNASEEVMNRNITATDNTAAAAAQVTAALAEQDAATKRARAQLHGYTEAQIAALEAAGLFAQMNFSEMGVISSNNLDIQGDIDRVLAAVAVTERHTAALEAREEARRASEQAAKDAAAAEERSIEQLRSLIESTRPESEGLARDIDALNQHIREMGANAIPGAIPALDALKERLREMDPMYKTLKDATIEMSQSIASSFADALVEGKDAMEGLKDTFKNFVKVMIAKALELYVFNHIINSIFNLTGSAALPTGQLFRRATGGAMQPNQPVLVGERGPELIIPSSAGNILNAHNTRNALSPQGYSSPRAAVAEKPSLPSIIVNQTLNVSAGVAESVRAEMLTLLPVFKENTMAAVVDARRRGGSFGQAFG